MSNGLRLDSRLCQLQHWMQTVITHPEGIRPQMTSLEVVGSTGLSATERLAIYSRSYHVRLLQSFQAMFPALGYALGEDIFNSFVWDYLSHHPPVSYSLNQLADAFPQHLAETRPDTDAPPCEREPWPDFIIDLATLELAFLKVFDGPGLEDQQPCSLTDLRILGRESFIKARPRPAPCLRLFGFRYPVHLYMLAARRGEPAELPEPAESFVAMTRQNYRVIVRELSSEQYVFLKALDGQNRLGDAIRMTRLSTDLCEGWLVDWLDSGFFESLQ